MAEIESTAPSSGSQEPSAQLDGQKIKAFMDQLEEVRFSEQAEGNLGAKRGPSRSKPRTVSEQSEGSLAAVIGRPQDRSS